MGVDDFEDGGLVRGVFGVVTWRAGDTGKTGSGAETSLVLVLGLGLGFCIAWPTPLLNPSTDFLDPPADLRDLPIEPDRRPPVVDRRAAVDRPAPPVADFRFVVDVDFVRPRTLVSLFDNDRFVGSPELSLVFLLSLPWPQSETSSLFVEDL